MDELDVLLDQFLVLDNANRKHAEEQIRHLSKDPMLVPTLLHHMRENGIKLMTLEEIILGDEMRPVAQLAGIDLGVLIRTIKILEQRGRAAMFKGSLADDDGVKFSPS